MRFAWGILVWLVGLALGGELDDMHAEPASSPPNAHIPAQPEGQFREARHTNNWVVLVSTSRFWFNYRHMANVLSFYRTVKRLGVPDNQIIVMLSDDISCNPRNPFVGSVFKDHEHTLDLYGSNIEVDYRGYEVNVQNFVRLLTDRWDAEVPRSKRLMTDDRSNVLVYLTGHGGNDFLKFQDAEDIGAWDLADAFGQMWEKRRYNELLFMIDTCEANSMYSKMFSPNMIAVGSSQIQESSYANSSDEHIGVALIDRFTSLNLRYLEQVDKASNLTLADLFNSYDPADIASHPGIRSDLFPHRLDQVKLTDFFGNIQEAAVDDPTLDLSLDLRGFSKRHANSADQSGPRGGPVSHSAGRPLLAPQASAQPCSSQAMLLATSLGGVLLVGLSYLFL